MLVCYMLAPSGNLPDDGGVDRIQPPPRGSLTQRVTENNAFPHAASHEPAFPFACGRVEPVVWGVGQNLCTVYHSYAVGLDCFSDGTEPCFSVGLAAAFLNNVDIIVESKPAAVVGLHTRISSDKDDRWPL